MSADGSRGYVGNVESKQIKERFSQLLDLPTAELPLDDLCYLVCQLAGDDVDIAARRAHHQALAEAIPPTFESIVTALFGLHGRYHGNKENYYALENSLLAQLDQTGQGTPLALCTQALIYARHLGVPMVGIGMPGHFIIRCGINADLFADPFHGDTTFSADGARQLFERMTGSTTRWNESFLAQVNTRDIVFRMLNNLRVAAERDPAQRMHVPWILELSSWFPQGAPFDPEIAARLMSPFN
jgi:hypothetical protein